MNTGRYSASGLGTQTAALAIGGVTVSPPAQSAAVEQWDGSSWTSKTSISSARGYGGASGTSTSAIFFGGNPPSPTTATEGEYVVVECTATVDSNVAANQLRLTNVTGIFSICWHAS